MDVAVQSEFPADDSPTAQAREVDQTMTNAYGILSRGVALAVALTPLTPAVAESQMELNEAAGTTSRNSTKS